MLSLMRMGHDFLWAYVLDVHAARRTGNNENRTLSAIGYRLSAIGYVRVSLQKEFFMGNTPDLHFECVNPILQVKDMALAVGYYTNILGFSLAQWSDDNVAYVSRDGAGIYLGRTDQGHVKAWIWVGVNNAELLYTELCARGATILHEPKNYPWALELRIADPDGNILRIGSPPHTDQPYETV